MLNYRETEILNNLIKGEKYNFKLISEKYGVSDRAARYYINNIDSILQLLDYKITKKVKNSIYLDTNQDFKSLFEILEKIHKLSIEDRIDILKLILFFDEKGLNITKICKELEISRTTIKKDLKLISEEFKIQEIELIYKNVDGYHINGNFQKILIKKIELLEKLFDSLNDQNFSKVIKTKVFHYFFKYIKQKNIENAKKIIVEIEKVMFLNINEESYNKIFSYVLLLLNFEKDCENKKDFTAKKFLIHTEEYKKIEKILQKILNKNEIKSEMLIEITDLIMGININSLKNNSFEDWINEELIIKKMISKVSKIVKTDLTRDEILYNGLLYHIKPAMYRIKNNIQITNSVFQELILEKDPILEVVNRAIEEIESLFEVKFPEDEIALMGFHIKASIERNTSEKTKKVILICGLGYGSSKVLEQSLKENYDLDIVDVLPYYLIKTSMPNYKNIDLILSTIDLEETYDIPVIKINPLLKEQDFILLSKYGIRKNITKISLKQIMDIIKNNTTITDEYKLNKNNVQFFNKFSDWKEAITKAGNILQKNGFIKQEYIEEMIKLIEKHGAYIIIEEGMAIPHAPISKNVLKTGISLLIVKEKVLFPNGKGANIFLSFATINKTEHLGILNDLFELITKYNFIEKISKITEYEELEEFFRKELIC